MLTVSARSAIDADLPILVTLYGELEAEMVALKAVWSLTDGLPEPIDDALTAAISDPRSDVVIGEIDGMPVGFLVWRHIVLLPQAAARTAAIIEFIFTTPAARKVGVGEAMMTSFSEDARDRGIWLFDAIVPPGHRAAKNFFESNGFKARRITMHRLVR